MLDSGIERKVVTKSGSYFSFGDERLGQGRQNATAFLREHPDVTQQILTGIQAQLGADHVVSARLLPATAEPSDVTPVSDNPVTDVEDPAAGPEETELEGAAVGTRARAGRAS